MSRRRRHYIAEWADALGKSNAAIVEATGADKSLVSRWLKQGAEPGPEYLERLGHLFETSADRLYAPPPKRDHSYEADSADVDPDVVAAMERNGVSTLKPYQGQIPGASPDIDVSAGAGPGGLPLPASIDHGGVIYSADAVRGEIVLPGYLLSDFTRAPGVRVHWLKVRGDSMKPTLEDGDRVMVDTTDTAFGQGGIFVLRDPDGEVLVKRLRKLPGGKIELVSDNRIQGDMTHDVADVLVIGRVVGRLGRL